MNNVDIAILALKRAGRWLKGAERALSEKRWDDAVFSAQMCSEHAAKGVLISLGIEFPKQHDVSDVFVTLKQRRDLPSNFRNQVENLTQDLAELASERALSSYGFEDGIDVDYFKDYAPEAVKKGKMILHSCGRLVHDLFKVKI